jgi:hypothetical protein
MKSASSDIIFTSPLRTPCKFKPNFYL